MDPKEIAEAASTAAIVASVAAALKADATTKIIEDLSPVSKELGKAGQSILQIIATPLHVAASHAERLVWLVRAANGQIPEERRQLPAPSIAGPIFENVKYLEEGNPLLKLYEQLLASAMDRKKVETAHPAFIEIIKHLSGDEAVWLYHISKSGFTMTDSERVYKLGSTIERRTHHKSGYTKPPGVALAHNLLMYRTHLAALNLIVSTGAVKEYPIETDEDGVEYHVGKKEVLVSLSQFGELFANACIPTRWEFREPEEK